MRIFLDTEFIEDGSTIDLVSIGLVRADGAELYLESAEADLGRASEWVRENVLPHLLGPGSGCVTTRPAIARAIQSFCGPQPEFWGYFADYDWVAVCQLFGTMMELPEHWPKFCLDLKQWAVQLGGDRRGVPLPEQGKGEHNALADARWNRDVWHHLSQLERDVTRLGPPVRDKEVVSSRRQTSPGEGGHHIGDPVAEINDGWIRG